MWKRRKANASHAKVTLGLLERLGRHCATCRLIGAKLSRQLVLTRREKHHVLLELESQQESNGNGHRHRLRRKDV